VTWRPLARLRDDPQAALQHGGDLHQMLVLKAENGQKATVLEDLCAQRVRSRALLLAWDGRSALWDRQHRLVLAALQRRDPGLAERSMRRRRTSTRDTLLGSGPVPAGAGHSLGRRRPPSATGAYYQGPRADLHSRQVKEKRL
jgi:DNA-binding FadR family transcriptional regulator